MAAFKAHCLMGFWKHALVKRPPKGQGDADGRMGPVDSVEDLPDKRMMRGWSRKRPR